jgi:hypothetical protein
MNGITKAKGVLGVARIIILGNAYWIAGSSFINRFRRKPDKRSNAVSV